MAESVRRRHRPAGEHSVAKVEAGNKLVDSAGATMAEIVGSVQRVAALMSEIASASNEQSQGIGQVNQSIAEMDGTTQQNAALVEEAAAAAGSLQMQSAKLAQVVSVFKLEGEAAQAPAARNARPVAPAPRKPLAAAQPMRDEWEEV